MRRPKHQDRGQDVVVHSWSQHRLLDVARVKADAKTEEGETERFLGKFSPVLILPEEKAGELSILRPSKVIDNVVEVKLLLIEDVSDEHSLDAWFAKNLFTSPTPIT